MPDEQTNNEYQPYTGDVSPQSEETDMTEIVDSLEDSHDHVDLHDVNAKPTDNNVDNNELAYNVPVSNKSTNLDAEQPIKPDIMNEPSPEIAFTTEQTEIDEPQLENENDAGLGMDSVKPTLYSVKATEAEANSDKVSAFNPNPVVAEQPVQLIEAKSKKPKMKKGIIGLIVALFVVILFGGTAFALNSWYQNPQKVITDSIINAVTSDNINTTGTYKYESNDGSLNVAVDISAKKADAAGSLNAKLAIESSILKAPISITGDGLMDGSGNLYFKFDGLAELAADQAVSDLADSAGESTSAAIDSIVEKIDGIWVKVSSDDLKQYNNDISTAQKCTNDAIKKYKDDRSAIAEITNIYKQNQFIVVDKELGSKDGSSGFKISNDNKTQKAFFLGLKDTTIYKSLHACDSNFTIDDDMISNIEKDATINQSGVLNIWVSNWSHEITKVEASDKTDGSTMSFTISPKFNQNIEVKTPLSSIPLSELQTYIEELMAPDYQANPYSTCNSDNIESDC